MDNKKNDYLNEDGLLVKKRFNVTNNLLEDYIKKIKDKFQYGEIIQVKNESTFNEGVDSYRIDCLNISIDFGDNELLEIYRFGQGKCRFIIKKNNNVIFDETYCNRNILELKEGISKLRNQNKFKNYFDELHKLQSGNIIIF